jgi:hypothetical protein
MINWKECGRKQSWLIDVLFHHLPAVAEENHEELRQDNPVSQPRFEPSTSQILKQSIITTFSNNGVMVQNGLRWLRIRSPCPAKQPAIADISWHTDVRATGPTDRILQTVPAGSSAVLCHQQNIQVRVAFAGCFCCN